MTTTEPTTASDLDAAMKHIENVVRQADTCGRDVGNLAHHAWDCHYVIEHLRKAQQAIRAYGEQQRREGATEVLLVLPCLNPAESCYCMKCALRPAEGAHCWPHPTLGGGSRLCSTCEERAALAEAKNEVTT